MKLTIITTVFHDLSGLQKTCLSLKPLRDPKSAISWEHLVVDSSPDENQVFINTLAAEGWPIRHLASPPKGVYPAMNLGVTQSQGQIIWFLNSGDTLTAVSALQSALNEIETKKADLLLSPVCVVSPRRSKIKKISHCLVLNLLGENRVCHQSTLFTAQLFRRLGTYDESLKLAADYDFLWKCALDPDIRVAAIDQSFAAFELGGRSGQFGNVLDEFRKIHKKTEYKFSFVLNRLNDVYFGLTWLRIQAVLLRSKLQAFTS